MIIRSLYIAQVALARGILATTRRQIAPAPRVSHPPTPGSSAGFPEPDPGQLMLWSECAGRAYTTALAGYLVFGQTRPRRGRQGP